MKCPSCEGAGEVPSGHCHCGSGMSEEHDNHNAVEMVERCPRCDGSGEVEPDSHHRALEVVGKCPACDGVGELETWDPIGDVSGPTMTCPECDDHLALVNKVATAIDEAEKRGKTNGDITRAIPGWVATLHTKPAECRSCNATVYWCVTRQNKRMPLDPDGTSHFATCPQAGKWRKGQS